MGSYTRPDEVLDVSDQQEDHAPQLSVDSSKRAVRPFSFATAAVIALFILAVVALWQFCGVSVPG